MTSGIITVAYGKEYDKVAAHCMRYSRRFTELPFAVITNLTPAERHPTWNSVENVRFFYFKRTQHQNRIAKLNMDLITPFDKTLYIDADAVIQKKGVEAFQDLLDKFDIAFNWRITFRPGEKIWNIYARCMEHTKVKKPISIHNGGLIAFKCTPEVRHFFSEWLRVWKSFGAGREMAPMNCVIKLTEIKHGVFPLLYFADAAKNNDVIIQHNYSGDFNARFGIPKWTDYKPFDKPGSRDFGMERVPT